MKTMLFDSSRLLLVLTLFTFSAHATVTNVAWYRLGENDPGAVSGGTATNTTDLLGLKHLTQYNSPSYTNAVSTSASNRLGSSLAVNFNGVDQFFSNAVVSTAVNNFGIEAWVEPNANTNAFGNAIAYNGGVFNGWGLFCVGGTYVATFGGGVGSFTFGPVTNGTWAHLALVRDSGQTRLYFNGVAVMTNTTAPLFPNGGFGLGHRVGAFLDGFFSGSIDEVRVFSFAPGQFSADDLLLNLKRVTTLAASGLTANGGPTLNGSANPTGLPTSAWFEWGTSTNYGNLTPPQALGSGASNTNFSAALGGLFGGGTYHFRAAASNSVGLAFGSDQSFDVPSFYDISAGLPQTLGPSAWGDYDNDGRLDIVLTGMDSFGEERFHVLRNTGSGFTNINAGLPGLSLGSTAWGDLDNDGRLDLLLIGQGFFPYPSSARSRVFRNTGNGFTFINAGLPNLYFGSGRWGDYDNDGRLDILLTGEISTQRLAQVWRNTGKEFTDINTTLTGEFAAINAGLTGIYFGSGVWGDYDNDGRLDILLTGATSIFYDGGENYMRPRPFSQILHNTGNGFADISAGLPQAAYSSAAWGDYDNDGRLDILLTGTTTNASFADIPITQVWRNTGAGFTNINAGLPGVFRGSANWGDYDNDGRLDILLTGGTTFVPPPNSLHIADPTNNICQVWRNTGSGFTDINAGLTGTVYGSAAWGDYDNDGRLDILLTGSTDGWFAPFSQVLRNRTPLTNTPPTAPTGLSVIKVGATVILSWDAASDAQTPASGLTYNVRIGTTPGGSDAMGPMSSSSGLRRLPQMGNAQERLFAIFRATLNQPYYWSVQAIDTAFAGSPFAPEQSFTINTIFTPTNGVPVPGDLNGDGIVSQSELAAALANVNGNGIVTQSDLDLVLSNYFPYSPFLYLTNVAGLGGTNVTFALTNSLAGAFSVEYTTNLTDWYFLGPATPRYEFTDTNAPAEPQRYYRLRWP